MNEVEYLKLNQDESATDEGKNLGLNCNGNCWCIDFFPVQPRFWTLRLVIGILPPMTIRLVVRIRLCLFSGVVRPVCCRFCYENILPAGLAVDMPASRCLLGWPTNLSVRMPICAAAFLRGQLANTHIGAWVGRGLRRPLGAWLIPIIIIFYLWESKAFSRCELIGH